MDKRTQIRITLITIFGIIVAYLYINRETLTRNQRRTQITKEWEMDEPQGKLVDGRKNGEWTRYYKNGKLESIEHYLNDTLHGQQIIHYPSGQLYIKKNYLHGVEIDSTIWYHQNGRIHIEQFRDSTGLMQGPFMVYYDNGQPSQICQKVNGKFDGEVKSFYVNGQLRTLAHYLMGERTGKWIWLSMKGDTTKVETYE